MVIKSGKSLLFLDDDVARYDQLVNALPDNVGSLTWVSSAEAAIMTLKQRTFDVICLDHDLGASRDCGCTVADFIAANKDRFKNTEFIIHSWNPDGAEVMHTVLWNAGLNSKRKEFHINHV